MSANADRTPNRSRFEGILSGNSCPRPLYDRILLEIDDCVVVPTLGAIVPNWLLVIPKMPTENFAKWGKRIRRNPSEVIGTIAKAVEKMGGSYVWFEHGAMASGSSLSCGVDHAHLHIIINPPFVFRELVDLSERLGTFKWSRNDPARAYKECLGNSPYIFAASGKDAVYLEEADFIGSQFFRRVVAMLAGVPDEWNYKTHPHADNIQMTISTFETMFSWS